MNDNSTSANVLVVEDDACVAFLYKNMLQKEGYQVEHCSDGELALQLVAEKKFDAVVLDLMMPKVDGMQVLKAMRSSLQNPLTPVIIVTAAKLQMVEQEAFRCGAKLYLDKTQHPQLLAGLREIMAARSVSMVNKLRMAPPASVEEPKPAPIPVAPAPRKGFARFFGGSGVE
jgi:CheY-like chemotaxis protein